MDILQHLNIDLLKLLPMLVEPNQLVQPAHMFLNQLELLIQHLEETIMEAKLPQIMFQEETTLQEVMFPEDQELNKLQQTLPKKL